MTHYPLLKCFLLLVLPLIASGQIVTKCTGDDSDPKIKVTSYLLTIDVKKASYDGDVLINKCNAELTEEIVYDLHASKASKDKQYRTMSLDTVDEFHLINVTSDNANVTESRLYVFEGERDLDGNRINSAVTIGWLFNIKQTTSNSSDEVTNATAEAILATSAVKFTLKWRVVGLVKEDDKRNNYFEWRPFIGNFLNPDTQVKNITVRINLPWGSTKRSENVKNLNDSDAGYTITTSQTDTVLLWNDENVTAIMKRDCWQRNDGQFYVKMSFDRMATLCNKFPPWIYATIAFACLWGIVLGCSFLAFIFFEKPYKHMIYTRFDSSTEKQKRINALQAMQKKKEEEEMLIADPAYMEGYEAELQGDDDVGDVLGDDEDDEV